jgi:hypothetical protein
MVSLQTAKKFLIFNLIYTILWRLGKVFHSLSFSYSLRSVKYVYALADLLNENWVSMNTVNLKHRGDRYYKDKSTWNTDGFEKEQY